MDQGKAYEIADLWVRSAAKEEAANAQRASAPISHSLPSLIPDGDLSAAIATVDDERTIVILQRKRLFSVSTVESPAQSTEPEIKCRFVTLDPARATLTVKQSWTAAVEGPVQTPAIRRVWSLEVDGAAMEVVGLEHTGGFSKGLDDGELLGRAIAAQLGWTLPATEG